jgi:UDP-2,3-diacylglucosamine pyrophosphatase LpxH
MEIAVISDLHLGRGDRIDPFQGRDAELIRFLNHLERSFERIILLGDIFETLTGAGWGNPRDEFAVCGAAHPEVARRFFERPAYTYVHGNHDWVAGSLVGAPAELELQTDGMRLLFLHGHPFDWIFRRARRTSEFLVCLGGHIQRLGLQRLHRLLAAADRAIRGASVAPDRCRFQRWALAMAAARGCDAVITGHTHIGRVDWRQRLYANSGACVNGPLEYLAMDTRAGVCRLLAYEASVPPIRLKFNCKAYPRPLQ